MVRIRYLLPKPELTQLPGQALYAKHFHLPDDPCGWRDCNDGSPVTLTDDDVARGWDTVESSEHGDEALAHWRAVVEGYDRALSAPE